VLPKTFETVAILLPWRISWIGFAFVIVEKNNNNVENETLFREMFGYDKNCTFPIIFSGTLKYSTESPASWKEQTGKSSQ